MIDRTGTGSGTGTGIAIKAAPLVHRNNFDALRLVAALFVMVSHQSVVQGYGEFVLFGNWTLGYVGVAIFFVISGYLVTGSWIADPHLPRFAARRMLRILPGLAAVTVFCALVLGPMVSTLPLAQYVRHRGVLHYLATMWLDIHFVLPGVFESNPYRLGVNGSLWTIPIEAICYVCLAIAGLAGIVRSRVAVLAGAVAVGAVSTLLLPGEPLLDLGMWFGAGVVVRTCAASLSGHRGTVAAALLLLAAVAWVSGLRTVALVLVVPPLLIALARRCDPLLCRAGRYGDFSYGLYIYAFPMQQTVVMLTGNQWHPVLTFAAALVLTLVCAVLSWKLVEEPCLRLKPRRPAQDALVGGGAPTAVC